MIDVKNRVKEAIKESGLSYREISEKTGISKSAISNYANMEVDKIPLTVVEKLATALMVDTLWLTGWEEEKEPTIDDQLLSLFKSLSDDSKKKAIEFFRFLAQQEKSNNQDQ